MTPLPLHRLHPAAQSQALAALHRARRGRPLEATLGPYGGALLRASWSGPSPVPTLLYPEGDEPPERELTPRVEYRGLVHVGEGGADYEALAERYEEDEAWWGREGWRPKDERRPR